MLLLYCSVTDVIQRRIIAFSDNRIKRLELNLLFFAAVYHVFYQGILESDPEELADKLSEGMPDPEEMQRMIARRLGIPVSKVYGVVTFYAFFTMTAKGKYPISVCMGTACYVRGSEKLLEEFKRVLGIDVGETTPDGKFSLDCLRCVGACGLAPVVMIGDKVYGRLQPVDVKRILEELD